MTDEERRIISEYVARVSGAGAGPQGGSPWGGSVPQTQSQPPLPPVDPQADAFIAQLFQQYPTARYRLTQTAFVQEAALVEAQNRIRQLEWERDQAQAQAQQAMAQAQQAPRPAAGGGGFLGGLFGGGQQRPAQPQQPAFQQPAYAPPPQPQYPPGYNPGAFAAQAPQQQQGPSFLGGALRTAAGVAGGLVVGNMLMNAFSHHGQNSTPGGGFGGFGSGASGMGGSPWSDPGQIAASHGWDGGGPKGYDAPDKYLDKPAYEQDATPASWGGNPGGGWQDDGSASGGGYDNSGGGGDYGGGDSGGSNDC